MVQLIGRNGHNLNMQKDEEIFLKNLCQKIRQLRIEQRITLEQTEGLGWKNWRHLQYIEKNPSDIRILTLFKIAKLYKKNMGQILSDVDLSND